MDKLSKLNESGLFGLVSLQIARRHKTLPRKKALQTTVDVIRRKSDSSFSNRLALAQCQEKMISDIFGTWKIVLGR